jgi:hypothetical protein
MVTEGWLRNTFADQSDGVPDHAWLCSEIVGKVHAHVPPNERDESLPSRVCFGYINPAPLLAAILGELEGALNLAVENLMAAPEAKGGRRPPFLRHDFIRDLGTVWSRVGLTPTSGPSSKFTVFCAGVHMRNSISLMQSELNQLFLCWTVV